MLLEKCPGKYCGQTYFGNDTYSDCGACPRGYRVDDDGAICKLCEMDPSAYDWLYLGFMAIIPLIMHWFFIDAAAKERHLTFKQIVLHGSACVEVVLSAVITILLYEPYWSFSVHSCEVRHLSDWYTLFLNPRPNYEDILYCTQEAVFPLQTMVLQFYLFCTILMMLIRPWLNSMVMKHGKSAVYSALYFFPILAVLHAVAGGLIYYAFPYLSIIISMISNAVHLSMKLDQTMKSLFVSSFVYIKNLIVIVAYWILLAYGIISLHQHLIFLVFVPFPTIFYILTVKFTDPANFYRQQRI